MALNEFDFLSPADFRYFKESSRHKEMQETLTETARIECFKEVELVFLKALSDVKILKKSDLSNLESKLSKITAESVYKEERRIKHDIRSLINEMKKVLPKDIARYVHLGMTSNDLIDTSTNLRLKRAVKKSVLPELKSLLKTLIRLAEKNALTIQIGRTHGQHAVPITFGYYLANYVERLGFCYENLKNSIEELPAVLTGATGTSAALKLYVKNPSELEKKFATRLKLKRFNSSTQLAIYEPRLLVLHNLNAVFGVLANLADDFRNLQRTEIAELQEHFEKNQVGSSTMPHKMNPISFENIKSQWKAYSTKMSSFYMDQISDHQRDLTNSASQRFIFEYVFAVEFAIEKMNNSVSKIQANKEQMRKNFDMSRENVIAEPLYVLLSIAGDNQAHEQVRKLVLKAKEKNTTVLELVRNSKKLMTLIGKKQFHILENPELYTGEAITRTKKICKNWKNKL